MIFTCSLQSGSNGNCFYVETPDTRLLVDAGISAKLAKERLASHKRNIDDVDALLITHNHGDHVKHAGVYHRKFSVPVYITNGSWGKSKGKLGVVRNVVPFQPGESITINETVIETIPTPHDGIDGVAYIICSHGRKLGIFTDLGHCFEGLHEHIGELDALYLESNYDPQMLADGGYPLWLKKRIEGQGGHLSNQEAANLILQSQCKLQWLVLSHLSEHNNCPELAYSTAFDILGDRFPITMASRSNVSDMYSIE